MKKKLKKNFEKKLKKKKFWKKIEKKNFEKKKKIEKKNRLPLKKKIEKKIWVRKKNLGRQRSSTIVNDIGGTSRPGVRPGVVDDRWRPNFGFFKPIFLFQT